MNEKMNDILTKLAAPFHPSRITWKPQATTGKKDKALAVAYADARAYQNRLDEVCGLDWSVSYTPWGDRIICHVTINGITRSSTGEADSQSERSEIAGTAAESQAFKRACAMFGLGRYLYSLPALWVEYDAANQRFTDQARTRLNGIILQHYRRWQQGQKDAELEDSAGEEVEPLRQLLDEAGQECYGQEWPVMRAKKAAKLGVAEEALTAEQIQSMINGLRTLKAQRANGVAK